MCINVVRVSFGTAVFSWEYPVFLDFCLVILKLLGQLFSLLRRRGTQGRTTQHRERASNYMDHVIMNNFAFPGQASQNYLVI